MPTAADYYAYGTVLACIAAVVFFYGLWMIYGGMKRYSFVQKINNLPTSKVEGAAMGLIELSGKARGREPVVSPISKVRCAYWRIRAEYVGPKTLVPLFSSESSKQFYLEDETGKMLVDSQGADIHLPDAKLYQGYISDEDVFGIKVTPLPPEALDFINGLDPASKALFMDRKYKNEIHIFEDYIEEGAPLYVLGSAEPQSGTSSGVRYQNLVVKKGSDNILYISESKEGDVVKDLSADVNLSIFKGLAVSVICLLIVLAYVGLTIGVL